MKITLVALGSRSAGPVYSFQMAQALSKRADVHLQIIISREVDNMKSWDEWFQDKKNVSYHKIDTYKHNTVSVITSFFNPFKIGKLVSLINRFRPDVVYCPFGLMWSSFVFPFLRKTTIITTLHDPHPYTHGRTVSQFILANIGFLGEKYVSGRIVLNRNDADFVANKYHCKVQVIPHAAYSFYVPENYQLNNTIAKRIAFIGRIDCYKGIDVLVDAFDRTKTIGLKLLIAGSGQIDETTLEKINSNPDIDLQNRYIANEEIPCIMSGVDMIILPYTNATQSGVIPMAFAFGKPVISTNVGSLSEQVPDGTGLLVTPDAENIALAIDHMYSQEVIIEYSKNAKVYADKALTWEYSAELLVNYCKELLRNE